MRSGLLGCRDARHTGEMPPPLQAARETVLRVALMPDAAQSRMAGAKRKPGKARFIPARPCLPLVCS